MLFGKQYFAVIVVLVAWPAAGQEMPQEPADHRPDSMAASSALASERIQGSIEDPVLS